MDPDACLARLIDAAIAGDVDELIEASTDLAVWLEKGGAAPAEGKVRERINREPHPNETGPTWRVGKRYLCPYCNEAVVHGAPDQAFDSYRNHCHSECLAAALASLPEPE